MKSRVTSRLVVFTQLCLLSTSEEARLYVNIRMALRCLEFKVEPPFNLSAIFELHNKVSISHSIRMFHVTTFLRSKLHT